jgi:stringent starvation protein B
MQPLPPKKEVALALLESSSVYVHLDPRKDGVVVPARFRTGSQLVLQVGFDMPIPIPDLDVGEDALSCTLSFSRVPFHCTVPWSAVYAIVGDDGRGMVWPDDVPPEVAEKTRPKEERAPALREVPPPAESAATLQKDPKPAEAKSTETKAVDPKAAEPKAAEPKAKQRGKKRDAAPEPEPDVRRRIAILAKDSAPPPAPEPALAEPPAAAGAEIASEPPPSPQPTKKPKRELPPYLRVVK